MFNKALIVAGFALGVAACASTPSTPTAANAPVTAAAKPPPAGCVSETGTRIPLSPTECAAAGHTWTQSDVKATGATQAGQALRLLDPTVTVK
jgi:hypothetical protein